jgi:CheY-like chemotaxis protein
MNNYLYYGTKSIDPMFQDRPIVIVDDDPDDQELIQAAIVESGFSNQLVFFTTCKPAFEYLKSSPDQPFLIICDVNLPIQSGIEFKRDIDNDQQLRQKSIPFVFLSTSVDRGSVDTAYKEMTVQGFFRKSHSYQDLKHLLKVMIEYWNLCKHPNSADY